MSSHENATPIRILHNSAGHLGGPARSLGGVVIGYLGVRVFSPRPVAKMIENVGGCSVLLGEFPAPNSMSWWWWWYSSSSSNNDGNCYELVTSVNVYGVCVCVCIYI